MLTSSREIRIEIAVDGVALPGTLTIPHDAVGNVIFAHGSGSSRLSLRNVAVAHSLNEKHCATLLFDLLDPAEARDRRNVFDIELLASRMLAATHQAREIADAAELPIGYFGASTGAAAALVAAAQLTRDLNTTGTRNVKLNIAAIVSRGGRPDLAGDDLPLVTIPTLLLVGSRDEQVIELNRQAQSRMRCETRLTIIPGATHLFEEPGTLEQVAEEAGAWFASHFQAANQD